MKADAHLKAAAPDLCGQRRKGKGLLDRLQGRLVEISVSGTLFKVDRRCPSAAEDGHMYHRLQPVPVEHPLRERPLRLDTGPDPRIVDLQLVVPRGVARLRSGSAGRCGSGRRLGSGFRLRLAGRAGRRGPLPDLFHDLFQVVVPLWIRVLFFAGLQAADGNDRGRRQAFLQDLPGAVGLHQLLYPSRLASLLQNRPGETDQSDVVDGPEGPLGRRKRRREKEEGQQKHVEQKGNEDHAVEAYAALFFPDCGRHHLDSSGGSVIIPNLSTPAFLTSAMTSTTNP